MKKLFLILLIISFYISCSSNRGPAPSSGAGKAGSMARFAINGNFLYTLNKASLNVFDISKPHDPVKINKVDIHSGIETIFPYKKYLFLGTRTGMIIFLIGKDGKPKFISQISHFYSCDPVVVDNDYAYVTLRDGSSCRRGKNELQIYDVANKKRPLLLATYPMQSPGGLGIINNTLFVLDGKAGLKALNVKDKKKAFVFEKVKTINGYDLIPYKDVLIITSEDGIYQYNYQKFPLKLLSKIEVGGRAKIAK